MRALRISRWSPLLEVSGVFLVGHLLAVPVSRAFGVPPLDQTFGREFVKAVPDYLRLAGVMGAVLLIQYTVLFLLAWAATRLRRTTTRFGLQRGQTRPRRQLTYAVAAFCLAALPLKVLLGVHTLVPLGQGPPAWILFEKPWPWTFWLFAGVASFGLVPVLEEMFYRGYCQARLEEEISPSSAVWVASTLFVMTHAQYRHFSILSVGSLIGIFLFSLGLGALFSTTRSLIGPMVLHALLNVPVRPSLVFLQIALMVLVLALLWRPFRALLAEWRRRRNESVQTSAAFTMLAAAFSAAVALVLGTAPVVSWVLGGLFLAGGVALDRAAIRPHGQC